MGLTHLVEVVHAVNFLQKHISSPSMLVNLVELGQINQYWSNLILKIDQSRLISLGFDLNFDN